MYSLILILIISLTFLVGCATPSQNSPIVHAFTKHADGTQTYILKTPVVAESVVSQSSQKIVMYQQAQAYCLSIQDDQQTKAILERLNTHQENFEMVFICN